MFLPMMTMDSERGCGYEDIKDKTTISIGGICLCENQDDVLLMMDLVNQMVSSKPLFRICKP